MIDAKLVERLDAELETDLTPAEGRLGKVKRYLDGDHDLPYMPKKAKKEFIHLAKRSITNLTPLLSNTFAHDLFVDGFRQDKAADNERAWDFWQANALDARQAIIHRGALEYGASYMLVLPGSVGAKRVPVMRPLSPLRSAAWYQDEDDDYPELALRRKGKTIDGTRLVELFDRQSVYTFALPPAEANSAIKSTWRLSRTDDHGLGVTPFVRFRDRLDGEAKGIVRPVINLQDRTNEVVFATLIALQYASFRQRWATGLAIPEGDDGEPVEPFQTAVDRLWVSEDEGARFGDFAQTEISGHLQLTDSSIKTFAFTSQLSPHLFSGDLVNISGEALASLKDTTRAQTAEFKTNFGESWELGFRLAAKAAGDAAAAADTSAQVRWRDTEGLQLPAVVDALGKLTASLNIPAEGLWEKIPGVTSQDITYWKSLQTVDPLAELTKELTRQTAAVAPATPPTPVAPPVQ